MGGLIGLACWTLIDSKTSSSTAKRRFYWVLISCSYIMDRDKFIPKKYFILCVIASITQVYTGQTPITTKPDRTKLNKSQKRRTRHISFGSQSDAGAGTREILMTVLHTLKKRTTDVTSAFNLILTNSPKTVIATHIKPSSASTRHNTSSSTHNWLVTGN